MEHQRKPPRLSYSNSLDEVITETDTVSAKEHKFINKLNKTIVEHAEEVAMNLASEERILAQDAVIAAELKLAMYQLGVVETCNDGFVGEEGRRDHTGEKLVYFGKYLTSVMADRETAEYDHATREIRKLQPALQFEVCGLQKEYSDRSTQYELHLVRIQSRIDAKQDQLEVGQKLATGGFPIIADAALEQTRRDLEKYQWFEEGKSESGEVISISEDEEPPQGAEATEGACGVRDRKSVV